MAGATGQQLGPRAKELTPEQVQKRREEMHELLDHIKAAFARGREALWEGAAYLDLFDEQSGWTALNYEKVTDFLADPEIGMSQGRYYDLLRSYRQLKAAGIAPAVIKTLDYTKVRTALPAVKQGRAKIDDVIDDVKTLGQRDLREKYADPAQPKPDPEPDPGSGVDPTKPVLPPDAEPQPAAEVDDDPIQVTDGDGEPLPEPDEDPDAGIEEEDLGDRTGVVEPLDDETAGLAPPDVEGTASDVSDDGLEAAKNRALERLAPDLAKHYVEGGVVASVAYVDSLIGDRPAEPAEHAQNPQDGDSGHLSAKTVAGGISAAEAWKWLVLGKNASSDAMRLNGINKAMDFVGALIPDLRGDDS